MSRFRKVDIVMWGDEKFLDLSDKAMLVFIFILTCPQQTSLGAMRASVESLAHEFLKFPGISESRWSLRAFRRAFCEISDKKMVCADEKAALIWLPNFLKHNRPANPNVVKSWVTVLETLPECETRSRIIEHILLFTKELEGGYLSAFKKAMQDIYGNKYLNKLETVTQTVSKQIPKQTAIQEQEAGAGTGDISRKQEQEQEHRNTHPTPKGLSETISLNNALLSPPDPQSLVDKFNEDWNRSWDWWKARLENIQIKMWRTISLKDEQLLLLIEGENGKPGFEDPAVLYLAIAQIKKTPTAPFRYLQTKAKDQDTLHRLRKKAECMNDEDF